MFSALTHSARRAVPQFLPRHARLLNTAGNPENKDTDVYNEAMGLFRGTVQPEPAAPPSPPPAVAPKPANLDNMHHHIPPAQDPLLHFLATMIMQDGKYATASNRISRMLLDIHALTGAPPMPIVRDAILKASPAVKCLRHRQGGKTVLKPVALSERQRTRQGIKWIIDEVFKNGRAGKKVSERLASEIIAVSRGRSPVLGKKEDAHKAAMVNRGGLPRR